jgi:hypothetical protein
MFNFNSNSKLVGKILNLLINVGIIPCYFNKSEVNIEKKKNKANDHFKCCDFEKPTKNHEKFLLLITDNDLPRILKSVTVWGKGTREFYKKSYENIPFMNDPPKY